MLRGRNGLKRKFHACIPVTYGSKIYTTEYINLIKSHHYHHVVPNCQLLSASSTSPLPTWPRRRNERGTIGHSIPHGSFNLLKNWRESKSESRTVLNQNNCGGYMRPGFKYILLHFKLLVRSCLVKMVFDHEKDDGKGYWLFQKSRRKEAAGGSKLRLMVAEPGTRQLVVVRQRCGTVDLRLGWVDFVLVVAWSIQGSIPFGLSRWKSGRTGSPNSRQSNQFSNLL